MQDMLVRLLDLPDISEKEKELLESEKVVFRRPIPPEKSIVVGWVKKYFSINWADETEAAFSKLPVNCFVAQRGQTLLGFACFESTAKNFFGPTGVIAEERGKDIGKVLLVKSLVALREMGYAYAIIGGVGPTPYYEKAVNARVIANSEKSIYQNLLKHNG
ncbi:GNAT family N-acetyltransferase [Flagellimonas marina]